ncbi:hypothetical protein KY284_036407 [Solanum tuberosum]|nr:hypothetical protein KY284_036407 [Solanum tuberosum]
MVIESGSVSNDNAVNNNGTSGEDLSSPLYMHPSNNPGASLVQTPFDGELEDRYDQTNGAKLYQVQREINELSQGTLDITTYYTRMKRLWEELSTLHVKTQCNCNCTCGAKDSMFKVEQDRRLIQFLMGLNKDEKQREIKPNAQVFMESTSLNATSDTNPNFRTNYSQNNSYNGNMPRIICDYCKKS